MSSSVQHRCIHMEAKISPDLACKARAELEEQPHAQTLTDPMFFPKAESEHVQEAMKSLQKVLPAVVLALPSLSHPRRHTRKTGSRCLTGKLKTATAARIDVTIDHWRFEILRSTILCGRPATKLSTLTLRASRILRIELEESHATCGVTTILGTSARSKMLSESHSGFDSNTSVPKPAIFPCCNAHAMAYSSMMAPLATLTTVTPFCSMSSSFWPFMQ